MNILSLMPSKLLGQNILSPYSVDPASIPAIKNSFSFNHIFFEDAFEDFSIGKKELSFSILKIFSKMTYIMQ